MAKFCQSCGTPCQEGELFCGKCGAQLPQEGQPIPTAPAPAPAAGNGGMASYAALFKRYLIIVLAVVAVFSLVLSIMNLFGTYDVKMSLSGAGLSDSDSGPISDLYDSGEFTGLHIVNILYGLVSLGLAALSVLTFLNLNNGTTKTKKLFDLMTMVALFGTVVYMILFWITNSGKESAFGMTIKYSVSLHFTIWIALILYGALFAADKLLLKDDNGTLRS